MIIFRNISLLFIIFIFSCRKENINGTYVEVDDSTRAVTYYKVHLDCNTLSFRHINNNLYYNYALNSSFTPVYDKNFSYYLYGDSFKTIQTYRISSNPLYNVGFVRFYNMGKVNFYKDKIIISHEKFSIKVYHDPYAYTEHSSKTYKTRIFYKSKFINDYIKKPE